MNMMNRKQYVRSAVFFAILLFFSMIPTIIFAEVTIDPKPESGVTIDSKPVTGVTVTSEPPQTKFPTLQNPLKVKTVEGVIDLVVNIAMYLGLAFGTLMLIYSGFKFITAQGDPGKVTEAKDLFFAVIIGIAVLISARLIVEVIRETLTSAGVVKQGVLGK